ncbi:MAG: hypothetical protein ABI155_16670 [Paralcaligenes sp.]
MSYPSFFDKVKTITLYDPLTELLGAADQGLIEYSYLDAVKLAGHSCPTVAGAYLMTLKALKNLYGDSLPQRGSIKVEFRNDHASGVTGVIANVVSQITGATTDTGFKGLGGNYDRRNLLFFNAPINGDIRFQRTDTGAAVTVSYHPDLVPSTPGVMQGLQKILGGAAQDNDRRAFAAGWQDRVRKIFENIDHPGLVTCA